MAAFLRSLPIRGRAVPAKMAARMTSPFFGGEIRGRSSYHHGDTCQGAAYRLVTVENRSRIWYSRGTIQREGPMAKDDAQSKDGPKFYVTRRGELYIKGGELLRSKAGREALREAAEAMENWQTEKEPSSAE